ncbi:MAG: erg26, C-3 sterol dehydrogenase [Lichina confinis]|nr:MAG: erg26, C-3 sterol dehydrogenase [Lichina confinis]
MASATGIGGRALGSVLVVGGCGFLGQHIVRLLLDDPGCDRVAVLDNNVEPGRLPRASYHQGDVTSVGSIEAILSEIQPRVIIHTAAPIPHHERVNLAEHTRVTIDGTANLLRYAKETPSVKAFVFTSTCAVIAGSEWHLADETSALLTQHLPLDPYRETKAKADAMVLEANDATGLRTASLRPGGIFGEGEYQVIPPILAALKRGQTNVQMGSSTTRFDMVDVENVADAHVLAAKALLADTDPEAGAPKVDGEAFFITNDDPWLYWDFVSRVWAEAGHEAPPGQRVWVIPNRAALAMASAAEWIVWLTSFGRRRPKQLARNLIEYCCVNKTFSGQKAKDRLGYVPRVTVGDGIARAVAWAERTKAWESLDGAQKLGRDRKGQ